jgi:hypothetical protein
MKKSLKLLVCLVSLVLVVSALCIAVSADSEPVRVIYPTVNTTFEKWDYHYNANAGETASSGQHHGIQVNLNTGYGHFQSAKSGNNTYLKIWNEKGASVPGVADTAIAWFGINSGSYGANNKWNLAAYDFVVIDFELGTDTYMNPETKEALSEYEDGAVLAYPMNAKFTLYVRAQPTSTGYYATRFVKNVGFNLVLENGKWYAKMQVSGNKIELSQTAGEWNHFTIAVAVDKTPVYKGNVQSGWKFSQTDAFVYLNGKLVDTVNDFIEPSVDEGATVTLADGSISTLAGVEQIRVDLPKVSSAKQQDMSLCFDNIQTSYYQTGYKGDINEVIGNPDKSLAEADDVLLGGAYQRPYPSKPVATLDDVNFYYPEASYHFIKNGSVLEIFESFETPCYINNPMIVKSNGYDFSYTTDSYELQKVGNDLYFVHTTDPIRIIFDGAPDSAYQGPLYDDSLTMAMNATPKYPVSIPDGLMYTYNSEDETVWFFRGWSTEKGKFIGEDEELAELPLITQSDIYYGCYYIYPVYTKLTPAYFVELSEGNEKTKTGYHSFDTLAESLKIEGAKITFNSEYTGTEVFEIENNTVIDANGSTIRYFSNTKYAELSDGVYTFRDATDEDKITVNWYAVGDDNFENPINSITAVKGNTISFSIPQSLIVKEAYSAALEKVLEFVAWSDLPNNEGEALTGELYAVPREASQLNFYPTYNLKDCAYYVELNGVKTGYLSYSTLENHTVIDGAKIHLVTPYNDMIYVENDISIVVYENSIAYYSDTKYAEYSDGVYTFRDATDNEKITVNWYAVGDDEFKKPIASKTEIIGNTIDFKSNDRFVIKQAYSAQYEKILEYKAWSLSKNNEGEVLEGTFYTIPYGTAALNFYPMFNQLDCAYYVELDGVKTGYLSYQTIGEHLRMNGAKLHLVTVYEEFIKLEASVSIVVYDNSIKYYSATQIASFENGVYTFRPVTAADYVDVSFVDLNGKLIYTEKHIPGNTIQTPELDIRNEGNISIEHSNDFYKTYLAWEKSYLVQPMNGDENPNVYKPTNSSADAVALMLDIKNIKYNFSAFADFKLNIYLPDPANDNIQIKYSNKSQVQIGGKNYVMLGDVLTINPEDVSEYEFVITISVYGEENTWTVKASLPEYFKSILESESSTKEEKELAAAAANYCNEIYKQKNEGADFEAYKAIVDANSEFFTAIDGIIASEDLKSGFSSIVKKYVSGMKIYYDSEIGFTYAFIVADNDDYAPGSYIAADGTGIEKGQFGIVINFNGVDYGTRLVTEDDGTQLLVVDFNGDALPAYENAKEFTFSVWRFVATSSKPAIVTGAKNKKYSLALYINENASGSEIPMLKTLYSFAYAAESYNAAKEMSDDNMVPVDYK